MENLSVTANASTRLRLKTYSFSDLLATGLWKTDLKKVNYFVITANFLCAMDITGHRVPMLLLIEDHG